MDPISSIANAVSAIFQFLATAEGNKLVSEADADLHGAISDIIKIFHGKISTPVVPAK